MSPGFWTVVLALLRAARWRALGRARRNVRLAKNRRVSALFATPGLVFVFGALFGVVVQIMFAAQFVALIDAGARVEARAHNDFIVSSQFLTAFGPIDDRNVRPRFNDDQARAIAVEALRQARVHRGEPKGIAQRLTAAARSGGKSLVNEDELWRLPYPLPDRLAAALLLWWTVMLICQSESARPDNVEVRRPMWEWLFSHPAPPAAIYLAEMLSPIAANPIYVTAPLMPMALFGLVYGIVGVFAGLVVGVAFTVALACVGRAIEFGLISRLSVRARGAAFGLMNIVGFGALMAALVLGASVFQSAETIATVAQRFAAPAPAARALIGLAGDGGAAWWRALALDLPLAVVLIAVSVAFSVRASRMELGGYSVSVSAKPRATAAAFTWAPLYRREWLWFRRDGSAIVQAVIAPLMLAAIQAFNMRALVAQSFVSWNGMTGAAILFGAYILLTLGPKSLASEGQALWIALTWPQGLESLLKTKARLWASIASVVVLIALALTAARFPGDAGYIALTAVLWLAFARSLSEKVVTLASPVSASGEPRPTPGILRWASALGLFSFAVGVMTKQASLAIAGVVYSTLTAAAMWQNFRFRLPYLFDPWSEIAPPPPTLLHAMIAISAMIEGASILSAGAVALLGGDSAAVVTAAAYGIAAIVVCGGTIRLLRGRNVALADTLTWPSPNMTSAPVEIVIGLAAGAALGGFGRLYLEAIELIPAAAEALEKSRQAMAAVPHARAAYFVMAVAMAPFAEEYLFRGLLYRALDREWRGARALIGAAVFFAVYHPLLAWPPVFALGALNALLFRRTGRLTTSIAAHAAYNAIVLGF